MAVQYFLVRRRQEGKKLDLPPPWKVFSNSFPGVTKVPDQLGMPGFFETKGKGE